MYVYNCHCGNDKLCELLFPIRQNGLRSDLKVFEKDGHYVTLWVKNAQKVSFSPFFVEESTYNGRVNWNVSQREEIHEKEYIE